MLSMFRFLLALGVIIAAVLAVAFVWTGERPAYLIEVGATYGIVAVMVFAVMLITRPAGQRR